MKNTIEYIDFPRMQKLNPANSSGHWGREERFQVESTNVREFKTLEQTIPD